MPDLVAAALSPVGGVSAGGGLAAALSRAACPHAAVRRARRRNDLASDGPVAHPTLHHGGDRASRIVFREYLGLVEPKLAD